MRDHSSAQIQGKKMRLCFIAGASSSLEIFIDNLFLEYSPDLWNNFSMLCASRGIGRKDRAVNADANRRAPTGTMSRNR